MRPLSTLDLDLDLDLDHDYDGGAFFSSLEEKGSVEFFLRKKR